MLSLSINHLLEVFESHLALSGATAGDALLYFNGNGIAIGHQSAGNTYRDLQSPNRFQQPLSALEQKRLQTLDRKAKGGLLTEQEDAEFEALLEIRRFHQAASNGYQADTFADLKRA